MNNRNQKSETLPSIAKILWYRYKVDKWSVKKIAEEYNISKSTLYRWFKILKDEEVNENYLNFELENIEIVSDTYNFYKLEEVLSKEYLKSSIDMEITKEKEEEKIKFLEENIPNEYNSTYSFALPLDPYRIFIYWEIKEEKLNIEKPEVILKVIDNTQNQNLTHMILTSNFLNSNMYIPVGIPDRVYFVELYLKTKEGKQFITKTNEVRTPRDKPASKDILEMYNWYNIEQLFGLSSFFVNKG